VFVNLSPVIYSTIIFKWEISFGQKIIKCNVKWNYNGVANMFSKIIFLNLNKNNFSNKLLLHWKLYPLYKHFLIWIYFYCCRIKPHNLCTLFLIFNCMSCEYCVKANIFESGESVWLKGSTLACGLVGPWF
jgi:hypothetical protein